MIRKMNRYITINSYTKLTLLFFIIDFSVFNIILKYF